MLDRDDIETQIKGAFGDRHPDVIAVYLFGSIARGDHTEASDIDVAVLLDRDPPRTLAGLRFDLKADLEGRLGQPVDLVVINHATADFVHHVLRDGRLLIDRDPSARATFEVRMRNIFFDLQPFIRRYRRPRTAS